LQQRDVEAIDRYAAARGMRSRSAVVREAIAQLREVELQEAYKESFREWAADPCSADWEVAAGDGLSDETR
jgi:predicted transcriptional regulator